MKSPKTHIAPSEEGAFLCLERLDFVEWEEAHDDWADDAAVRNGAEAIAGIPRIGTFTVVTGDE